MVNATLEKLYPTPAGYEEIDYSLKRLIHKSGLHIGVSRFSLLTPEDKELLQSPYRNRCGGKDMASLGEVILDAEDLNTLESEWQSDTYGAPENFITYLRTKYGCNLPLDHEKYRRLKEGENRSERRGPSAKIKLKVFRRDGFKCRECGSSEDITVDHIIPRRQGGPDDISNYQTLCRTCNSRKGAA